MRRARGSAGSHAPVPLPPCARPPIACTTCAHCMRAPAPPQAAYLGVDESMSGVRAKAEAAVRKSEKVRGSVGVISA